MFSSVTKKILLLVFAFTVFSQKAGAKGSDLFIVFSGGGAIGLGVCLSKILTYDSKTKKCNQLWDALTKKGAQVVRETIFIPLGCSSVGRLVTSMKIIFPANTSLEELNTLNAQWDEVIRLQNRASITAWYGMFTISLMMTAFGILALVVGTHP